MEADRANASGMAVELNLKLTRAQKHILGTLVTKAPEFASWASLANDWPRGKEATKQNIRVHVAIMRTRLASYGIEIDAFEARGFVLNRAGIQAAQALLEQQ